jgi:hypothetical protein
MSSCGFDGGGGRFRFLFYFLGFLLFVSWGTSLLNTCPSTSALSLLVLLHLPLESSLTLVEQRSSCGGVLLSYYSMHIRFTVDQLLLYLVFFYFLVHLMMISTSFSLSFIFSQQVFLCNK